MNLFKFFSLLLVFDFSSLITFYCYGDSTQNSSSDEEDVIRVDEVKVSDKRQNGSERSYPFFGIPHDEKKLEESDREVASTASVLESTPSVRVRRFGSYGSPSFISMRGGDATHTLVVLEEIPLNDSSTGTIDLSTIPLFFVDSIEIYRKAIPVFSSPMLPSGAIVFRLRRPEPGIHFYSGLVGGFYPFLPDGRVGTEADQQLRKFSDAMKFSALRKFLFSASDFNGTVGAGIWTCFEHSEGDYSYFNDNGTIYNVDDDKFAVRKNNAYSSASGMLSFIYLPDEFSELKVSILEFARVGGVAGLDIIPALKTRLFTNRTYASFLYNRYTVESGFGELMPSLNVNGYMKYYGIHWHDPMGEVSLSRVDSVQKSVSGGVEARGIAVREPWALTGWSGGISVERFSLLNNYPSGVEDSLSIVRLKLGGNFFDTIFVVKSLFRISTSLRFDGIFDFATADAGITGEGREMKQVFFSPLVSVELNVLRWLKLNCSFTYNFRPPVLIELYGNQGWVIGNPELESESGPSVDAGVRFDFSAFLPVSVLSVEYTFFYRLLDNLITYIQNSQKTMVARNIGRADIRGIEVVAKIAMLGFLSVSLGYTFLIPVDKSGIKPYDGRLLPNRPLNDLYSEFSLGFSWVSLSYRLDYLSRGYIDRTGLHPIADRDIHSFSAKFSPGFFRGFIVGIELWNIRDKITSVRKVRFGDTSYRVSSAISDLEGYPLEGFSVYFTIAYTR